MYVTGFTGVPSCVAPPALATEAVPAEAAAVPGSPPPEVRYRSGVPGLPVGDGVGLPVGLVLGLGVGLLLPVGVGVGSVPPPALPPLQVNAPDVAVFPAGTASVVPLEKVTVSAFLVMFDAT